MRGLIFELVFVAMIVVTVALVMPRPLTWLGWTQIALTVFVGAVLVVELQIAWWLHSPVDPAKGTGQDARRGGRDAHPTREIGHAGSTPRDGIRPG